MTSGLAPGRHAERLLVALAIVLASAAGASAGAQDSEPQQDGAGWGVQQLMRELGAVKRSQSRFVERKYLKVLKAPLELRGTLTYVAPGNLVKRTLSPKPETLTVEGDRLTLESTARNESRTLRLRDYPVLWAFVESIRSTLSGDIAALERFYRVELEGGRARWRLYLVPRDPDMRAVISLINIGGSRDRVERIEVQETRGDRSVTTIVEESR
jgi:hypothetical protein